MQPEAINEIRACLPRGRTLFHDAHGRYAFLLLGYAAERHPSVSSLRRSPFAQLLEKPAVRQLLAAQGDGRVTPEFFRYAPADDWQCYTLSLTSWPFTGTGRRTVSHQVSRMGKNLVLQLNFSNEHDRHYEKLNSDAAVGAFGYTCHPVRRSGRFTLAWARLDIDIDAGEALVEEVQSDWLRDILDALEDLKRVGDTELGWRHVQRCYDIFCTREIFHRYAETTLKTYRNQWHDAMLSAAIFFLREELGIRRIFYHTPESHKALKRMGHCLPPRSLYTKLPRRFCFRETGLVPDFLSGRYIRRAQSRCPFLLRLLEL